MFGKLKAMYPRVNDLNVKVKKTEVESKWIKVEKEETRKKRAGKPLLGKAQQQDHPSNNYDATDLAGNEHSKTTG